MNTREIIDGELEEVVNTREIIDGELEEVGEYQRNHRW